jgi:basic membrane protein A
MGAPSACENAGIPNVSYNGSTYESCPETFLVSSAINWAPYYNYMIKCVVKGEKIAADWCGGIKEGSVVLSGINQDAAAEGTVEKVKDVIKGFKDGTVKVFDTKNFTVKGAALAADHKADIDTDAAFTPDTAVVENGIFNESKFRSAPYFDVQIDGITLLNTNFGE